MRQLKLVAAVGGAVALIGIWPLAVGQIGQTIITDGVKNFSNQDVKVELEEYHRGYFSSEAKVLVTVTDPQAVAQLKTYGWPTQYELIHDIHHGVFSLTGETYYANNPQLKLDTKTQLNGNTEFSSHIQSQKFAAAGHEPVTALLSSLTIDGSVTVLGHLNYTMSMPSLELDYASGSVVHFAGLTSNGDGKLEQDMWMGEQTVSLDSFVVNDYEGVNVLEANGFNYQFKTSQDEQAQTLQGDYQLAVKEFKNHDGEAANLNLSFTASGFDKSSFLELTQMYQESPVWTQQDTEKALPKVDSLLQKGFSLSLNKFGVDIDEGRFETNWNIDLPEGQANSSQDVLQLLNLLQGNMKAFVSSDLVMAYPFIQQNLDELLIMDVATQEKDGYSMLLKLHDGKIKLSNGTEVPVQSLLMPMLMQQTH
ncbi:hypothetical protein A9264_07275 [Vibrio sp. UCD-FRSSP16_10]|uniref:DUF945 family protein n=1 Tax=unclassified Vibrio TaxID=2614977 RepID=UPI0007FD942B|nr:MULTISPECIES: DUF945 family protein [unclassified Vibrio]OBT13458.1 hypothetical protein A9264_07275 [Vibrio sp. UCD-FRSSP16_10]OBT17967.1 hypothetical protein A9260_01265 [Vibrio sp. UCD-FRSSP16_30]